MAQTAADGSTLELECARLARVAASTDQAKLLLVSLLDNFCSMYDREPAKNERLFYTLCRQLSKMGVLGPVDFVDETTHIRNAYKRVFKLLLLQAVESIEGEFGAPARTIGFHESSSSDETHLEPSTRYREDFEEFGMIGRGGFGNVYRARNRLDGSEYAIKKVPLGRVQIDPKMLREIKGLAQLDHPNIVRYHSAWIEHAFESAYASSDDSEHSETQGGAPDVPTVVFYIQMQLCHFTLRDWIDNRNALISGTAPSNAHFAAVAINTPVQRLDAHYAVNRLENVRIFRQIVRGVAHIHSHGFIHRDLKPENIFFHGVKDWTPKIGDFGLVASVSDEPGATGGGLSGDMTGGVGTHTYASPEQLGGSAYSFRTDIYSLGIIFLEMCCPMATHMERAHVLAGLRGSRQLPVAFLQSMPKEAAFVLWCTATDPEMRPSAQEILDLELLDHGEEMINDLVEQLNRKELEIERLQQRIKELTGL